MTTQLSVVERAKLENLEEVISHGLQYFVDVSRALVEIRDERLYRKDYSTFQEYCRDRWDFSEQYANQLIRSAKVAKNLEAFAANRGDSETRVSESPLLAERHARELTRLDTTEEQAEAWEEAVHTAPNGRVTTAHVAEVVDRKLSEKEEPDETPADSSNRDAPKTDAIKTDVEKLIERIEKLIEQVNAMAARRMSHNNHSRAVVGTLKKAITDAKSMARSWRNS